MRHGHKQGDPLEIRPGRGCARPVEETAGLEQWEWFILKAGLDHNGGRIWLLMQREDFKLQNL